jgi:hypothetical protein
MPGEKGRQKAGSAAGISFAVRRRIHLWSGYRMSINSCASSHVGSALDAILGTYAHMPGLRLTCEQASRLWALEDVRCQGLFDALVDAGFLTRGSDGAYMRPR